MDVHGAILAGGAGRRLGGAKALAVLGGQPLVLRVLHVLTGVVGPPVAVVVKAETELPPLPAGAVRVEEPEGPLHPLTGIRAALEHAAGAPVLCCAVDLPLVSRAVLLALARADRGQAGVVVPVVHGRREPACALWTPAALGALAAAEPRARLKDVVAAAAPLDVPIEHPGDAFLNVNTPEDLAAAERCLRLSRT